MNSLKVRHVDPGRRQVEEHVHIPMIFVSRLAKFLHYFQYAHHVRTAASNVAKSLPPLPILLENEAAAANFVGKWGRRGAATIFLEKSGCQIANVK